MQWVMRAVDTESRKTNSFMERRTKSYLQLIKPGITLSNTLAAVAGFFLASSAFGFELKTLVGITAGIALVIASACVANNIIDRDIDARMKRTKGREVAVGNISVQNAVIYAALLGIVGFWLLLAWTNVLTAGLGLLAYFWYVAVYGIAKRTTPLSTIIGGVCGALPPVAGYTAVTGHIDIVAVILFALWMVWQLPHFYAISIFRRDDYSQANLPVWSVKYGNASTRRQMLFWVLVFLALTPALVFVGATCNPYLVVMVATGLYWAINGIAHVDEPDEQWARRMFKSSIYVLLVTMIAIGAGGYLM